MEISREQFLEQRHRRFGATNPQRMDVPYWEMMVRNGKGAYWARDHFQESYAEHTAPVWCFDRFGMSQTTLDDGRTLFVAGEHEDFYDPDFCIYNDVIVKYPDDQIEIFAYPRDVFPPTDFHSATLVGDRVILIGNLGYRDERRPGYTQVFALSLEDLRMGRIETHGQMPGWIGRHEASLGSDGGIVISRGQVIDVRDAKQRLRKNLDDFSLDLARGEWRQLTNRVWQEFSIRAEPRMIGWWHRVSREDIKPIEVPHSIIPGDDRGQLTLLVDGARVSITLAVNEIEILIEGALSPDVTNRLLEGIRSKAEAATTWQCVLEKL